MTITLSGTSGVTFPNASVQSVAGVGSNAQTWQNVAASRVLGTTYTNSTGYPIALSYVTTSAGPSTLSINGTVVADNGAYASAYGFLFSIIPNGATYSISGGSISRWFELR